MPKVLRKDFMDAHWAGVSRRRNDWAASDRGWYWIAGQRPGEEPCIGHYLDYGPDHYRSPHEYCKPGACNCRLSQPGNVHAVICRKHGPGEARYFETVAQAQAWLIAAGEEAKRPRKEVR